MQGFFFFSLKALHFCAKPTKGNCSEYCWGAAHPQAQQLRFQQDSFSCLYFQDMIQVVCSKFLPFKSRAEQAGLEGSKILEISHLVLGS